MEVIIERIGINMEPQSPAFGGCFIMLKEKNGEIFIPIFIGQLEANSIIIGLDKIETQRPMTHDLLSDAYKNTYDKLDHIEVNEIKEGTFYGKMVFEKNNNTIEIDSRPSDAIAVAVRYSCPIFVSERVVDNIKLNQEKIKQVKKISTLWPF